MRRKKTAKKCWKKILILKYFSFHESGGNLKLRSSSSYCCYSNYGVAKNKKFCSKFLYGIGESFQLWNFSIKFSRMFRIFAIFFWWTDNSKKNPMSDTSYQSNQQVKNWVRERFSQLTFALNRKIEEEIEICVFASNVLFHHLITKIQIMCLTSKLKGNLSIRR